MEGENGRWKMENGKMEKEKGLPGGEVQISFEDTFSPFCKGGCKRDGFLVIASEGLLWRFRQKTRPS